ncbi:MAG: hypothetical protein AAGE52_07840 [Myxococcota bacterium]
MRTVCALVLLAAGCGAPWAVVVQSGPPSAIAGATQLTYASDFNQLILDGQPVANLLAAESPDEQANLQAAFQQMDQEFLGTFTGRANAAVAPAAGPPQPGEVRLTAIYENIQRGARGPIGSPTRVTMRFSLSVGGQVTDEVQMSRAISPSLTRSSVARRLHAIGRQLGDYAGRFFNDEQGRQ